MNYNTVRLKEINMNKELPQTKFSAKLIRLLRETDGRLVLIHVNADHPRWYELPMDGHKTYDDAINAFRIARVGDSIDRDKRKLTKTQFTHELKIKTALWREWLRPSNIYIRDYRTPAVVAITEAKSQES